jgi:hypothetical protein
MNPFHSDQVAELIRGERLRAAAAHRAVVDALREEGQDDLDVAPSFARRALGFVRGAAHVELRHHA